MKEDFKNNKITLEQAYKVTFVFLEKYYQETKFEGVGSLLSDMSLVEESISADPAMLSEWLDSVKQVLDKDANINLLLLD